MKEFWDSRFAIDEYIYGKDPNHEFGIFLKSIKPGRILFPAEGEGRNAVYAASLGWEVVAFDQSIEGKKKAEQLANEKSVTINYTVHGFEDMKYKEAEFDCIALIFTHLPPDLKKTSFAKLVNYLKPGGYLFLLGFSKEQLGKPSGGPKDLDMLFSIDQLKEEFKSLEIHSGREFTSILNEGEFHKGEASLLELIAIKR
jgi:SAM-dependent methyltransferase